MLLSRPVVSDNVNSSDNVKIARNRESTMAKQNTDKSSNDALNFEQAYEALEKIVARMELGEQSLEQSLEDFEQGVGLMKHCHKLLKDAEQKVEVLVSENNAIFETKPFNEDS